MASARPLHEIFAGLAGDAAQAGDVADRLSGGGHPDLPDGLVAEAIVSYADTATVEVAEHLAPFVTAHSAVPLASPLAEQATVPPDAGYGLGLVATAPAATPGLDAEDAAPSGPPGAVEPGYHTGDGPDLAFGEGSETREAVDALGLGPDPGTAIDRLPALDALAEGEVEPDSDSGSAELLPSSEAGPEVDDDAEQVDHGG